MQVDPDVRIKSPVLSRGIYEIYLGSEPVIPAAKAAFAAGAKFLQESDQERRDSWKPAEIP